MITFIKKKYSTFFSILFSTILFSSCAIHKDFPFICFRKECVLGQLGYYQAKDFSVRAKANIKSKKNKRQRNRERKKTLKDGSSSGTDSQKNDSLSYSGGRSSGICRETKLVFSPLNSVSDTIVIYYNDFTKDLSDLKKKELKEYIEKIGAISISEILIKNCHDKNVLSEHEISWLDERSLKIKRYLKKLHVPATIIKTEE